MVKRRCQLVLFFTVLLGSLLAIQGVYAQKKTPFGEQLIEVPFTTVPPSVDGVVNADEWSGSESNTVDFINLGVAGNGGPGETDGPEDISYTFHVLYDETFLYIGVEVSDDVYISTNYGRQQRFDLNVTWNNDAVEYFFDGDLSRTTESSRNPTDSETGGQWIYGIDSEDSPLPYVTPDLQGVPRSFGANANDDWYAVTTVDSDLSDWQQEARFALSIIGSPSPGSSIGFNINVDDVDEFDSQTIDDPTYFTENRQMQLYWTIFIHDPGEISTINTHEMEEMWGVMAFLESTPIQEWSLY